MFKKILFLIGISIGVVSSSHAAAAADPIITAIAWREDSQAVAIGFPDGSVRCSMFNAAEHCWTPFQKSFVDRRHCVHSCGHFYGIMSIIWKKEEEKLLINEYISFLPRTGVVIKRGATSFQPCFRCDPTLISSSFMYSNNILPLEPDASPNHQLVPLNAVVSPDHQFKICITTDLEFSVEATTSTDQRCLKPARSAPSIRDIQEILG